MAKWKCNDTACLNQWSEKDPTCCPQCGSTDFEQIGSGGGTTDWSKIAKIAGGILIAIIIILMLKGCPSDITATITFKETSGSIKVELDIKDKDKKDYVIEILRSGTIYDFAKGVKLKTFPLSAGTYYVNVKYIGEKKGADKPNIIYDKTKGPYIIDTPPPPPPPPPTIVSVVPIANSHTQKYTLTVKIKPDSLTKLCEFSIDGSSFSPSNVFNNVPSGTYNITARLINDNSIQDIYPSLTLIPIVNTPPTPVDVQALLNKISNGDENSFNQLSNLLPTANITVTGAGGSISTLYALMVDCYSGNRYIVEPKVINNETTTINARKK